MPPSLLPPEVERPIDKDPVYSLETDEHTSPMGQYGIRVMGRTIDLGKYDMRPIEDDNIQQGPPLLRIRGVFVEWAQELRAMLRQNRDAVVMVTGAEGEGKTTIATVLALLIDPDRFSAEHYTFSAPEYRRKATQFPKHSCIIVDEVVSGWLSRDAMTRQNKDMMRLGIVMRVLNHATIVCVPRKNFVDRYFSEHRVRFWMHVYRRGYVKLYVKVQHEHQETPYWAYWGLVKYRSLEEYATKLGFLKDILATYETRKLDEAKRVGLGVRAEDHVVKAKPKDTVAPKAEESDRVPVLSFPKIRPRPEIDSMFLRTDAGIAIRVEFDKDRKVLPEKQLQVVIRATG